MRWIFAEQGSIDAQIKAKLAERIAKWWQGFPAQTSRLSALFKQEAEWDLPAWMEANLQGIHPNLMWEYGPAVKGEGHRLVITPESHRELRPLVMTILKQAPQIPGWEFYGYRLPEDVEQAELMVQARTEGTLADVTFRPAIGDGKRIDLTYYSPRAKKTDDPQALNEVFVGTEVLLGEEMLDKWVGGISVEPLPKPGLLGSLFGGAKKPPSNLLPLPRLHDTVQALAKSVVDQLPRESYGDRHENASWSTYEMQPEQADDYLHRDDILVGSSMDTDLLMAMQPGGGFHSGRFSRLNERFCYVKIDASEIEMADRLEARGELEEDLHAALKANKSGAQIGGAVGLRYVYIDLALLNVQTGLSTVRQVLKGRVSKRSWVFFGDADYCGEWLGVYPDSPPPPMPDFDE